MKLSTHNLLVCNKNTCINNEKNYPLIIKASKVNTVKSDFDEEKTKLFFDKMNKKALNEGCKDLNISKFDLEKIKEEQMKDKNKYAEYFGHIIKEIWINSQLYIVVHDDMRDLFALILVTDEVTDVICRGEWEFIDYNIKRLQNKILREGEEEWN